MLVALRPPFAFDQSSSDSFAYLEKRFTPRTVFMDIGGCEHAERAAGYVERVYAVDVASRLLRRPLIPCNLRLVLCDGVSIPPPELKVDVAWGADFMDYLHPDDAAAHLASVLRALAPGGVYHCITRKDPAEARKRLLAAGFSKVGIPLLSRLLKPVRLTAVK